MNKDNETVYATKHFCGECRAYISDDAIDVYYRPAVGKYGAVVLANLYCPHGHKIASDLVVDNLWNIPPRGDK